MSILNENISMKIKEIQFMEWNVSSVNVSARPYHALTFRLSGKASFSNGTINTETEENDVFYMPANFSYKADYTEKNEILVIHFESDLKSKPENYKLKNPHIVSLLFNEAYKIWTKKEDGYYYSAMSVICEILKNICIQQSATLQNETMSAFNSAIDYMENNYHTSEFSIEEMIAKAKMSDTYFRKLFTEKFKTTPSKYLTEKRLIYAEKLLSTGKYSIKEVSEMSGFGDTKYFCRVVKKAYGVPPSKLYYKIS